MRRSAVLLAMMLLSGCIGESADPTASAAPARPPAVVVDARGLPLFEGDAGALRFGFENAEPTARVIVSAYPPEERTLVAASRRPPVGVRLAICPVNSIDEAIDPNACRRDVGSGVRETVGRREMRGIAILALRASAETLVDVVIEFAESGRRVQLAIPQIRAPRNSRCADNACNPFVELRPTRGGPFTASARWEGPEAALVLLQGNVIGRAHTASGIPYHEPARDEGPSPLAIRSTLSAPAEYALVLRHRELRAGEPTLRNVRIDAEWP